MRSILNIAMIIILTMILFIGSIFANDLEDGIPGDDSIKTYDTLNKPGKNVRYIVRSARAKASKVKGKYSDNQQEPGDNVIGGVLLKPGAKADDITVIFNGKDISNLNLNK